MLFQESAVDFAVAPVQNLAFGSQGRSATGDVNRVVRVSRDGAPVFTLDLRSNKRKIRSIERIRGLAFSPDGAALYVACGDQMSAFDSTTGERLWAYEPPRAWGFLIISPISISVSPDGDVAMATDAGRVRVWSSDGSTKSHWSDNDSPRIAAYAGTDRLVGTDSFSLCVWQPSTGAKLARRKLAERVYGMAVSPNGRLAATRTLHGIDAVDVETLEVVGRYPVGYGLPLVAFSDDSALLAVNEDDSVKVYTVGNGKESLLKANEARIRSLRFKDEQTLAAGCSDGVVRTWHVS